MIRIKLTNRHFSNTVLVFLFVCLLSGPVVNLCQPIYVVMQGFPFHTMHFYAYIACGEVLRTERNPQPDTDDDPLHWHPSQKWWCMDAVLLLNTQWLSWCAIWVGFFFFPLGRLAFFAVILCRGLIQLKVPHNKKPAFYHRSIEDELKPKENWVLGSCSVLAQGWRAATEPSGARQRGWLWGGQGEHGGEKRCSTVGGHPLALIWHCDPADGGWVSLFGFSVC